MKLRSANCSLDFSDTSNIKLDNSNFYKDKSQKEDFFNDIINLFNTPKNMNLSHCDSPKDITRDSLILNLDETVCKGKHRKNSLSCSDMNMLIKNFDMDLKTNMKMNANSKKNEQAKAKVHEYLNKGNESGDVNYDLNAENSGKNSLNSSLRKKKENFIPKAELFSINRCEDSQSGNNNFNNKMREMNNKLNPIMN